MKLAAFWSGVHPSFCIKQLDNSVTWWGWGKECRDERASMISVTSMIIFRTWFTTTNTSLVYNHKLQRFLFFSPLFSCTCAWACVRHFWFSPSLSLFDFALIPCHHPMRQMSADLMLWKYWLGELKICFKFHPFSFSLSQSLQILLFKAQFVQTRTKKSMHPTNIRKQTFIFWILIKGKLVSWLQLLWFNQSFHQHGTTVRRQSSIQIIWEHGTAWCRKKHVSLYAIKALSAPVQTGVICSRMH